MQFFHCFKHIKVWFFISFASCLVTLKLHFQILKKSHHIFQCLVMITYWLNIYLCFSRFQQNWIITVDKSWIRTSSQMNFKISFPWNVRNNNHYFSTCKTFLYRQIITKIFNLWIKVIINVHFYLPKTLLL